GTAVSARRELGEPDDEEQEARDQCRRAPDHDRDDAGESERRRGRTAARELLVDVASSARRGSAVLVTGFRHETQVPVSTIEKTVFLSVKQGKVISMPRALWSG